MLIIVQTYQNLKQSNLMEKQMIYSFSSSMAAMIEYTEDQYREAFLTSNMLTDMKGDNRCESGFFYAPYIPLYRVTSFEPKIENDISHLPRFNIE